MWNWPNYPKFVTEVCTDFSRLVSPTHLHRPAEQTFAVHQQADSYTEEVEDQDDVFAVGDRPAWNKRAPDTSTPPSLQHICSHWHVVWVMKCAQSLAIRMLNVDLRETSPLLTRIVDFVHRHGPAEITHELSVSAVVNSAICRVVARDRTLPCRLNQLVGTSNPTIDLLVTATSPGNS